MANKFKSRKNGTTGANKKTFEFLCTRYNTPRGRNQRIKEWYTREDPQEPQLDLIPSDVTFEDCKDILTAKTLDGCPSWYYNLDSVPREMIWLALKNL